MIKRPTNLTEMVPARLTPRIISQLKLNVFTFFGDVNTISNSDNLIILPPPPLGRKAFLGEVAKAHHGVEGGADEEDHDGVEEDVAVDDGEGGVEGEEHAGQAGCREAGRQLPDGEEA